MDHKIVWLAVGTAFVLTVDDKPLAVLQRTEKMWFLTADDKHGVISTLLNGAFENAQAKSEALNYLWCENVIQ